jgi:rhodanese-related sulfurtransferase
VGTGVPEIQVEELKRRLDAKEDLFVLDVREPHEYQICNLGGHLIPLNDLPKRVSELDSSREIVVHCKMGGRSAKAVAFLQQAGFTKVHNLAGGINCLVRERRSEGAEVLKEQNQVRLVKDKAGVVTIPASAVTEISYGQDVHRRVGAAIGLAVVSLGIGALMALTKSKKHFVGLTWVDGDKKGGFAMQCDKNDYRGVLAGLEGVTGKKAVDSDAMTVKN